jgi:hypothetical protein
LISPQEHEAWEVLVACQGQLRLAPSGHVIGIDISTALRLGAARGSDLVTLSELLPAAEAGLVEFGMTGLDRAQQCPLIACLPPFDAHASLRL